MKIFKRIKYLPLLLAAIFFWRPALAENTLSNDYRQLVSKRLELEDKRKQYETNLNKISSQRKSLTIVFFQCISQKKKELWEQKIIETTEQTNLLENQRKEMVELRRHVDQIRRDLEKRRIEIESTHTRKGPGTPYETEFRQYMSALENEYFKTLDVELFTGYDAYLENLKRYNENLKTSVQKCMKGNTN